VPAECSCDAGFFTDELGNDCGSTCFRGYEAGHIRVLPGTIQESMYSGICICDSDYTGPACTQTCSTTQPHHHCLVGGHRASLIAVLSETEAVCTAPPQQTPLQAPQTVELSLTKTTDSSGIKHPEYTMSGKTVQIM
jgi:hypothetical protein